MKSLYSCALASLALLFLNCCSVLIGNVRPVEERAAPQAVQVTNPLDSNWKKILIKASTSNPAGERGDTPDVAWQSTRTAAVIALNSACRKFSDDEMDTKVVTQSILSSWRKMDQVEEEKTKLSGFEALQTTAEGIYLNRRRKFQLVVSKSPGCMYDLIFLSPVASFDQELADFQRFRDSLKLK